MDIVLQILEAIKQVSTAYHRLIILVGENGSGKTKIIRKIGSNLDAPVLNLNLLLSNELLELSVRMRAARIESILQDIVGEHNSDIMLFDNIELLFDAELQQDPLRLLQGISRNCTIISTWNGYVKDDHLLYAEAGHPEFRSYPISDLIIFESASDDNIQREDA